MKLRIARKVTDRRYWRGERRWPRRTMLAARKRLLRSGKRPMRRIWTGNIPSELDHGRGLTVWRFKRHP